MEVGIENFDKVTNGSSSSTPSSASVSESASASSSEESSTPIQHKRKRAADWVTPFRSKAPKCGQEKSPKKNLLGKQIEPEIDHRNGPSDQRQDELRPVPLPASVLALFTKPHVFPKQQNHEILKGIGFPPKILRETSDNHKGIVKYRQETCEIVASKFRSRARRASIDRQIEGQNISNENNGGLEEDEVEAGRKPVTKAGLKVKPDGTIVVTVGGEVIIFPVSTVSITRNSISTEFLDAKEKSMLE